MTYGTSKLLRTFASALVGAGVLAVSQPALALKSFDKTWQQVYAGSATADASCNVCHGTSNTNLNAYGKDLFVGFGGSVPSDITATLLAIEGLDSDGEGSTNLEEIFAGAQPGWTVGANNQIYTTEGEPLGSPISTIASVPLPYDPPAAGAPVADPDGPYAGNVDVPVTFDGSGSYDSDDTDVIVSYHWSFGDGAEELTSEPTVQHTYTSPGSFIVSLTVTDDEGDTSTNSTVADISGDAVLDLDIVAFKVGSAARVGKPVTIQLSVDNPGAVLGQALATVVGVQDSATVYTWSLNVYDNKAKGATTFTFPSYTTVSKGSIHWAVTIDDVDPDADLATAQTTVK